MVSDLPLWVQFMERTFPDHSNRPEIEFAGPGKTAEALWDALEVFRPHRAMMGAMAPSARFDEDADAALALLAATGSWTAWDALDGGTWRVLLDRIEWSLFGLLMEERVENSDFTVPLPLGVEPEIRTMAALLAVATGPGREPSEAWREARERQSFEEYLQTMPTWRQ